MTALAQGALQDIFEGFLVYRNLIPSDDRLPSLDDLRAKLGLPQRVVPRKSEPSYAHVVGEILQSARQVLRLRTVARHVLYVGDTLHNDVAAFSHLCRAMGWTGRVFIADEGSSTPAETRWLGEAGQLVSSNCWADIAAFAEESSEAGLGCDSATVIVIDMDKTLLGARGRNDVMIDHARQQAAYAIAEDVLAEKSPDQERFLQIYNRINHPDFHAVTQDNQDAVAYISLLVASGTFSIEHLFASVQGGCIRGLSQLIVQAEQRLARASAELKRVHDNVSTQVLAGNPTPFSAFRQNEYRYTTQLMGCLPEEASLQEVLSSEIAITKEVWDQAHVWKERGCIVFGLSDKPDEACFPLVRTAGALPIHAIRTHIAGGRR